MLIINWNVEWAKPGQPRATEILARIKARQPELICLTEAAADLLPGQTIYSQANYGYKIRRGRKALLWSANPWRDIDDLGDQQLPPGRFISGLTETSLGDLRVIGVCIPWAGSRNHNGRTRWQDHGSFLTALRPIIDHYLAQNAPVLLVGDFNQRLTAGYAPAIMLELLKKATSDLTIQTAGYQHNGKPTIDHIATGLQLTAGQVETIDNHYPGGRLSDHFGVVADLNLDKKQELKRQ